MDNIGQNDLAARLCGDLSGRDFMAQQKQSSELRFTTTIRLNYLTFLPEGYAANRGQKWPLILFLHGFGERGDNLELLKLNGLSKKLEMWSQCPFIVVSPQCPAD